MATKKEIMTKEMQKLVFAENSWILKRSWIQLAGSYNC